MVSDDHACILLAGPFNGIQFPGDDGSKKGDLLLEGRPSRIELKEKPVSSKLSPKTAGKVIRSHMQKKRQQVRNYNLKGDQ